VRHDPETLAPQKARMRRTNFAHDIAFVLAGLGPAIHPFARM